MEGVAEGLCSSEGSHDGAETGLECRSRGSVCPFSAPRCRRLVLEGFTLCARLAFPQDSGRHCVVPCLS